MIRFICLRVGKYKKSTSPSSCLFISVLLIFPPSERQSSLGHAPHEDPQSHYDLPVNSHIPGHYDLPPVRRPPSPRRTPQWRSQQQSKFPSSSLWGWFQACARKERANFLRSSLTIRAVDHPQSSGEAPVPPRSDCLLRMPPFSTQHCPSVG